jgi:hypothetical protein
MTKLDSVKILVPNSVIKDYNIEASKNNVQYQHIEDVKTIVKNTNTITSDLRGFKQIIIDNQRQTSTIEFSAKILNKNYIQGINKETIKDAIEQINKTDLILLNTDKVIKEGQFLTMDVTDNIKPHYDKNILFNTFANVPLAQKYKTSFYKTNTNLGVVWKGDQKTKKDRMIFYDKILDLKRDKSLYETDYFDKVFKDFEGVIRCEQNLTSLKTIKTYYSTNKLTDVLNSDIKPNYLKFDKMTQKTSFDLRLFDLFEGMSYKDIVTYFGYKGIYDLNNGDWSRIEIFIKTYNKNNYRRDLRKALNFYNQFKNDLNHSKPEIIEHIKNLLLCA